AGRCPREDQGRCRSVPDAVHRREGARQEKRRRLGCGGILMTDYLHRKSHTHQRAREALRKAGHNGPLQKTDALVYAIEVETGRACVGDTTEFIRAWLDSLPVAGRRTPATFKVL